MNQEDIIRMAREAGWSGLYTTYNEPTGEADWKMVKESLTVPVTMEQIERFAALVAAAEREAILNEWCMCVQSDLENGVKSLNERATEKWLKEYPAISGFDAAIRARGNT